MKEGREGDIQKPYTPLKDAACRKLQRFRDNRWGAVSTGKKVGELVWLEGFRGVGLVWLHRLIFGDFFLVSSVIV
jgi:hypothetical protein